MAPRGETRHRLVATAGGLFQRQGYNATGMNQVLAEAEAPKGSLYHHFPGGKEELAAAAVERAGANIAAAIEHLLASNDEPGEGVAVVVEAQAAGLEATNFEVGCPIATVALETAARSDRLQGAARGGFDRWIELIAARLERAGWPAAAAADQALMVLAALEGGLILARARRDAEPLRRIGAQLRREIDAGPALRRGRER
jgi:TetR/AcrR family transcriptional repressor of lmrAB and yxaGH operons